LGWLGGSAAEVARVLKLLSSALQQMQ
jgi:hypothetical protein